MKVRIISLFLSVAFLSLLTFEYISNTMLIENSNIEAIEYVLEKRVADKFIDDTYLLSLSLHNFYIDIKTSHTFEEVFYTFEITNTLFKPPITI